MSLDTGELSKNAWASSDLQFSQPRAVFPKQTPEAQSCFWPGEESGGEYGLELVPSHCVVGTGTIKS
jgi:hypothetical protein